MLGPFQPCPDESPALRQPHHAGDGQVFGQVGVQLLAQELC